jgi:hypothetical protein
VVLSLATAPATAQSSLTEDDRKVLESLLSTILFDPRGAQRIELMPNREDEERPGKFWRESLTGWLVDNKTQTRIYFTDGAGIAAPDMKYVNRIDFVARARVAYTKPRDQGDPESRAEKLGVPSDMVVAAWLYRLDEKELAARIMAQIPEPRAAAVASLRKKLAALALVNMVAARQAWADETALSHGERLFRLYPVEAASFPQASRLFDDLKQRKRQGRFGEQRPKKLPDDFAEWDRVKQVRYLVDVLGDVDFTLAGDFLLRYRRTPIELDFRLQAFIKIGETAVPALLDVAEKDQRLTRFGEVLNRRDGIPHVITVREAVLAALPKILRVHCFDTRNPPDDNETDSEDAVKKRVAEVQEYWKEFGQLPFDERMMKVLTDPRSHAWALREAGARMVNPGHAFDDPPRTGYYYVPRPKPVVDHAAVLKFKSPTVADALLAAHDKEKRDYEWDSDFIFYLVVLGDKRVAPRLAERASRNADFGLRRQYAHYANLLGESKPILSLVEDLRTGKMGPATRLEFQACVATLTWMNRPEADAALTALANPMHPLHLFVRKRLLTYDEIQDTGSPIYGHPYCLPILWQALNDQQRTGATFSTNEPIRSVVRRAGVTSASGRWAAILKEGVNSKANAHERACDFAALILARRLAGVPDFHALARDADERLIQMKKTMSQFVGKWRVLSRKESRYLTTFDEDAYTVLMAPSLPRLGRVATAKDVIAGDAIFELEGKGKPVNQKLPAIGFRSKDDRNSGALIVQAERGPDGTVTYGIVERHAIRTASAREFEAVLPVEQLPEDP